MRNKFLLVFVLLFLLVALMSGASAAPTLSASRRVFPPTPRAPGMPSSAYFTVYLPLVLKNSAALTLVVTSSAFTEGGTIPTKYGYNKFGCPGQNTSPPLAWTTPPAGTQSFALIMDDPDAGTPAFVHWLLFNISAATTSLPEDVGVPAGARRGTNDWGELGYGGPCPPPGPAHRYYFNLYALDTLLSLAEGATRAQIDAAMMGHTLAQGQLMGRYP